MGISHYPRYDYRIAPLTLAEILDISVPRRLVGGSTSRNLRLYDLDENVWKKFDSETCYKLSEVVVDQVRSVLSSLPESIKSQHLPLPSEGIELHQLELEVRTYNCLVSEGFDKHPEYFGEYTISDLIKIRGFGVRCLVDLLTSLESVIFLDRIDAPAIDKAEKHVEEITPETIRIIKIGRDQKRPRVPRRIRAQCLPKLPDGIKLDDFELKIRTYNCLKESGYLRNPQSLGGQTIETLLKIPSFGVDSLIDLLTALEPHFSQDKQAISPQVEDGQKGILKGKHAQGRLFLVQDELRFHPSHKVNQPEIVREARRLQRISSAKKIRKDDPRLGHLLRAIDLNAKTAYEAASRLVSNANVPLNAPAAILRLRELKKRIQALFKMKLEEELMSLAVAVKSGRNRQIIARRFGWDGSPGDTLQAVGEEFGVTRERVRQVCSRFTKPLEGKKPFTPILDRVIKFVSKHVPGALDEIESKLMLEGFTKGEFRLEGILNAAELLGRGVPYSIVEESGKRIALGPDMENATNVISQTARRAIEHWGVTTIEDVAAQVKEKTSLSINTALITYVLSAKEDFRWLDEASGWFWLSSVPRNRLLTQIEKILSVVERIGISELRAGVSRHHRMEGFAPPKRVLLELARQTRWCLVENSIVTADPRPDWEKVLSDIEQFMVLFLKEHGPVIQRAKFEELCLKLGMNRTTFYIYLQYSPVIEKYAIGVYGLRGAQIQPGVIESLTVKPRRRQGRVVVDFGWTQDGRLWIGYKLSEAILKSGVAGVPASIKRFLNNKFDLKAADGLHVGTMVAKEDNVWGLGPFFRRRGGDPGDYLLIIFNLAIKEAIVHIGDASLLDDFQKSDEQPKADHVPNELI